MVFSSLIERSSINANPSNSQIGLTTGTTDWLWAVFAIMLVSDLAFIAWSFTRPLGTRTFHHLPILILTTASIAYFTMASNLGGTPVDTEFRPPGVTRAIWYVRYIDWTITTPLLLLELLLATGLPLSEILTVIFFDLVMIIAGLVGALVPSSYKWGYFVGGCFALFYVWAVLIGSARKSAHLISHESGSAYTRSAIYLSFIWMLYPVAWGLADGGNVLHPSGEMIFYGILDILAKPVFCFWHAASLRKVPYDAFALNSGKISSGAGGTLGAGALGAAGGAAAMHHHDKSRAANGTTTTNGTYNNGTTNTTGTGVTATGTTGAPGTGGLAGSGNAMHHHDPSV